MDAHPDAHRQFRRRALLILPLAGLAVYLLWNVPDVGFLLYPFRLFVTYVHEAGHSLAALVSGGAVIGFQVFPNGGGVATTAGGARWLILPAGYLGAAAFGALLFYLTNTVRHTNWIAGGLGVFLIGFTIAFAWSSPLALLVGIAFGAALLALARWARREITIFVLNVLAILTGLNAVLDVWLLVGNSGIGMGSVRNDAAAFSAEVFFLPAWFWALLWSALAVAMLGAAAWFSLIRPGLRALDRQVDTLNTRGRR